VTRRAASQPCREAKSKHTAAVRGKGKMQKFHLLPAHCGCVFYKQYGIMQKEGKFAKANRASGV
jgi:hypothetical protein